MELSVKKKLIFLVFLCQIIFARALEVSTSKGKIIGTEDLKTRNGRGIYSFLGIPYALPPLGGLRFKEAQPPGSWEKPFNATKEGHACPQNNIFEKGRGGPPTLGEEDCLTLNVYSPKVDPSAKLPVMVFIHGGGYAAGSSSRSQFGPEFLLDKDIVLVTTNYRLGILGFSSSGDDAIPANLGLKDQSLAFRWVHDNINNFGGDPNVVTVFGESAGGASSHLNILSPLNRGLIHRAIAMSGTGFCPWALVSPQLLKDRTKALAVLSGCPSEPSEELLKCMQAVPVKTLLKTEEKFHEWILTPAVIFGPTIESANAKNAYLTTNPTQIESKVPFMTGVSSGEGSLVASIIVAAGDKAEADLKQNTNSILPKMLMLNAKFPKDKIPDVSQKIQKFYLGDKPISSNTQEFIDMMTDSMFLDGAVEAASKYSGDAYFYYYDYNQSVSHNSVFGNGKVKGVSHADIQLNLFPTTRLFPKRTLSETDVRVSEKLVDIWTNFAKHGKPSEALKWEPTGKTANSKKYLYISAGEPAIKENLLPERVEFWKSLNGLQSEKTA